MTSASISEMVEQCAYPLDLAPKKLSINMSTFYYVFQGLPYHSTTEYPSTTDLIGVLSGT